MREHRHEPDHDQAADLVEVIAGWAGHGFISASKRYAIIVPSNVSAKNILRLSAIWATLDAMAQIINKAGDIMRDFLPHCHGPIQDFESLGYWYGWAFGIIPPYWEELRLYVFRRDNYTCSKCHKLFPPPMLSAHHIVRKEDGGEDGSRNLITLCNICHEDDKPIFEDEQ